MDCRVSRLDGSLMLKMLSGVQPAMTLPALPHLTVPSLSRKDGPTAWLKAA
ncbi:hypothetical protein D3C85_1926680 [compost metagenome]